MTNPGICPSANSEQSSAASSKLAGTQSPVKKVYIPRRMREQMQKQNGAESKTNTERFSQSTQSSTPKAQTNNPLEMVRAHSWHGPNRNFGEKNMQYSNSPSTDNSSGAQSARSPGSSPIANRFSKNNLYMDNSNWQQRSSQGNYNDDNMHRRGNGYGSPRTYTPPGRKSGFGFGQPQMRRQRSAPNRMNRGSSRFRNRERSQAANPQLEEELFGSGGMTQGINFDIYDKIPVEVSGQACPEPVDDFASTSIPPQVLANIKLAGFKKPTPVQRYSIPSGINGRDLMSCAQTGSGKTAAFLVPIISRLIFEGRAEEAMLKTQRFGYNHQYQIHSLLLSPTRELAQQIHLQARKFLYRTGMRSVVVYGGARIEEQFRELDKGSEVLVATPGRLVDFLERGRMSLAKVLVLCMDEADRMLDMGFEPQIRQIISHYDMPTREDGRQTLMFSATFPREIQVLAQDYLHDYIFLAVGRVGSSTDLIDQKLQYCQNPDKVEALMDVLPECQGLTLIFVATRRDADRIERILCDEGVNARSIHGDKTQYEREAALNDFRTGTCPVLVATDVAARGLDIPSVMWVINYDLPNQIDAYVHRIGRTGRCGNRGNALSFVNESNKPVLRDLLHALRECGMNVPNWFVSMVNAISYGESNRRGKRRGSKFGARDARRGNRGGGNRGSGGHMNRSNSNGNGSWRNGGGNRSENNQFRKGNSNDAW